MNARTTRRTPARALTAGAVLTAVAWVAAPALAAGELVIDHAQTDSGEIQLLVTPPEGVQPDLADVTATVDGNSADATAAPASEGGIRRTVVLALDTNPALGAARLQAMQSAVEAYAEAAPDDVYVGLVAFNDAITTLVEPTIDHAAIRGAATGLSSTEGSRVYEATLAAADVADDEGGDARVVVVTASADTGTTLVQEAANGLGEDSHVDIVALGQKGSSLESLQTLAQAGHGEVVSANAANVSAALTAAAATLASQVAVSVEVPDDVNRTEGPVDITLGSDQGELTGTVFTELGEGGGAAGEPVPDSGFALPSWFPYVIISVIAAGLLLLVVALLPARKKKLEAGDVITQYTDKAGRGGSFAAPQAREEALAGFKDAAGQVLARNRGLEERIARRLDLAGSELKASEWLLIHAGCIVVAMLLGMVVGGGNLIVGLVFAAFGVLLPWMYLGFRRSRRVKAFNAALPDILQLMAGSLQAGLSLPQSVDTIVREGTEPVATEFRRVLVETRLGVDLEDALDGVATRFDSKDFAWVVMAIKIQRQVGGNLAELLNTVAGTMREREYMRRQVAALAAEGKLSAFVLGGLPPAFLVYLLLINRDYVMPLFTTPLGLLMLGGAALMLSVGAFWMSRLVKVEV